MTPLSLSFQKWDATGNDFVVHELQGSPLSEADFTPERIRAICDRDTGVGADGVVLLNGPRGGLPARVAIWNSDGSQGDMCGNALRCVALLLARAGWPDREIMIGERAVQARAQADADRSTVVIGPAAPLPGYDLFASLAPLDQVLGGQGYLLSFGNPHYVVPLPEIPQDWAERGGQAQETADRLLRTGGINCGFLQSRPEADGRHLLRVFERGVGVTKSCGSGACAASAVLEAKLGFRPPHRLELPGGVLEIGRSEAGFELTGPAFLEFVGQWSLGR